MTDLTTHMFLPASTRPWKPWKNGGGEMADIAVSPANADWDQVLWRIAIARIDKDGPFSEFPGIDRTFMIIGGRGVRLDVQGADTARIDHKSRPFMFPGEAATTARLIDGPTHALNVMARRGLVRTRIALVDEFSEFVPGSEAYAVLVWARGSADVVVHGETVAIGQYDGIIFAAGVNVKITPGDRAHGYLIEARIIRPGAAPDND